jgi:hypothetical protein
MLATRSRAPSRNVFGPGAVAAAIAALAALPGARAAGFAEPPVPAIGTRTVASADLYVKRPPTTPCTVALFTGVDFVGFTPAALSYVPPAGCPGPWAKVVLSADYDVSVGRQFDRTAVINLNGVNLYFGTTMEPGSTTARAWHVERDVTELSALFKTAQAGEAILGNVVDDTYTGRIHGSASLVFYPVGPGVPAAQVPHVVVPLAPSLVALSPTNPTLAKSVTLPRNTERLYLDIVAQSQASDEFWYTCVPDADAAVLQSCGGGPFREIEVSIDGAPAGVAPIFPWIYTGGISPYLWTPVPGVETLDFKHSRVDLTPFAGRLDDGLAHVVSVQVFGAQDNFSVTGSLLAFTDAGAKVLSGSVTENTLAAPTVKVVDKGLVVDGSNAHGKVFASSERDYRITGTLETSHGPVTTTVAQHMVFRNTQDFTINDAKYVQDIAQNTNVTTTLSTLDSRGTTTRTTHSYWPLTVHYKYSLSGDDVVLDTGISQTRKDVTHGTDADGTTWTHHYENTVAPHATTTFSQATGGSSVTDMWSSQHLVRRDSGIGCYDRTITVAANAVTAVVDGCTGGR